MITSQNEIAILDFGSQYTHLIARRIRELGVKSHIYPNDVLADSLINAVGIILSGGPRSLVNDPRLPIDEALFDLGKPILGLCYGHQLIAEHFGGKVESGGSREYGLAELSVHSLEFLGIFDNVSAKSNVWMSHGDHVAKLPDGFQQIASSGNDSIAAMADEERKVYGFQFHPEVNHTEHGMTILKNFVFGICKAKKNWSTDSMLEEIQDQIKKEAGDKNVFLLVSGGVDSTVCFALLEKTLGKDKVYGLHVDHGFMRENESSEVVKALKEIGLDDLHVVHAEEEYLQALVGVTDPEKKRVIIGEKFIDIVERVMAQNNFNESDWLLGQGTIYPDTIESGDTKNADKIKTHHNRVDRIRDMIEKGLIIEPIRELYKDEVRDIGRALGLPADLIDRHPFPGPGLAIRCLCSDTEGEKVSVIASERSERRNPMNDSIASETIYKLPIQSVGVQGDERSYSHPAILIRHPERSATKSRDLENILNELRTLAPTITNAHKDINRVLALVSGDVKKIHESTTQKATLTKNRLKLLRTIDTIVNKYIAVDSCSHIWQFPVILIPFGHIHKESVVLRPVESKEAMTVSWARLPENILNAIVNDIHALDAVDYIFYDVTNKPPGTIEWE